MTAPDIDLALYLTDQIRELAMNMRKDGLPNGLGYLVKIEERVKALKDLLRGEKPELPI